MMKPIESMWKNFEAMVLPRDASDQQRQDMRTAFYSGAAALWTKMQQPGFFSDDDEPTESDMDQAMNLEREIREFGQELDRRAGLPRWH